MSIYRRRISKYFYFIPYQQNFNYHSELWNNTDSFNLPGGETGFDSQETKLPTYWDTPFSKICLGMRIGNVTNFIVIEKQANSLFSLIADGQHRQTTLGRDLWKSLIGSEGSLQLTCNKEGFNTACGKHRARIGILSNNEKHCRSCNSKIGFGMSKENICGNKAKHEGDNGDKNIKVMGYILVR